MSVQHATLTRREALFVLGGTAAAAALGVASCQARAAADPTASSPHLGSSLADSPLNPGAAASAANQATSLSLHAPALTLEDLPWNLRLINGEHPLPDNFEAPELKSFADGAHAVDKRIYQSLQAMLKAARKANRHPVVCSSFRTRAKQRELYRARVQQCKDEGLTGKKAREEAAFWVARPGCSEHEAGLAVDLVDESYQELDKKQEKAKAQKWLMKHCADYGFILRYPTDKSDITNIGYEPWHYRYVGAEYARAITDSGLCFEEWLETYLANGEGRG
ncbi:M15 family metallopeptidase [Adlercreutzia equolifaciens]|uniref:M15 family metallopeptidase n=1 Tax=Adlercreutzia equolifaciens TaxID=446660 RepID=UPI0023B14892|nr:M15 family metallopeptidase [Adlercreutzia equolifaciens]MDE8702546.1 M15 family metallopeptidase [Adlercreutzia equolifaciens]